MVPIIVTLFVHSFPDRPSPEGGALSLPAQAVREFGDCAIALHDTLQGCGDFEGRELLDCVRQRLERAVWDVRARQESAAKCTKDTASAGEGGCDD